MNQPTISCHGLTRTYRVAGRADADVVALDGVTLAIPAGSFTAVVGASGSGKSTLLHCLAGLDRPTSGVVTLLGTDLDGLSEGRRAAFRAASVGLVFQDYNLVSSLTAADNVGLPARLAGRRPTSGAVAAALTRVGLAERARMRPHQLSGGERQRVAIARVMLSAPPIVFADEPTGALDADSARVVLGWLRGLADAGTTVVLVTHDEDAAAWADGVLVMRAGRVVASHTQAVAS